MAKANKPYLLQMYEPDRINFLIRCGNYLKQKEIFYFSFARKYGVTINEWHAMAGFFGAPDTQKRKDFIDKYLTNYGKA